jgi:hypothetical protein
MLQDFEVSHARLSADDISLIDKADDIAINNSIGDTVCKEMIYYIRSFLEFAVHAHLATALGTGERINLPYLFYVPRSKCPWGAFPPLGRGYFLRPVL